MMKALVYTGVEEMEFREEKEPSEKPGESILKVHASGICGSDMHAYHGKDERRIPPLILGHEVSGQIINGKLKDQISVLNPLITCRNCEYCKSGREHLCPDRVLLGMNRPYERQGAFAELITVPDHNIFKVPEKLDVKEAAVAEPTAVSYHAVLLAVEASKKPLKIHFKEALARLGNKERQVIQARTAVNGELLTLEAVGDSLGVTRERIRQIQKKYVAQIIETEYWDDCIALKIGQLLID